MKYKNKKGQDISMVYLVSIHKGVVYNSGIYISHYALPPPHGKRKEIRKKRDGRLETKWKAEVENLKKKGKIRALKIEKY